MNPAKSAIGILIAAFCFSLVFGASAFTASTGLAKVQGVKSMPKMQPIRNVGAKFTVTNNTDGPQRGIIRQTDAAGSFSVELAPGSYRVRLGCKDCRRMVIGEAGVEFTLAGTKEKDFKRILSKDQLVSGVEFTFEIVGSEREGTKPKRRIYVGQVSLVR